MDLGRQLVDGDRFAHVTLGYGIAIRVDRDIAVHIDDALGLSRVWGNQAAIASC
jgi:hypothetical protein